MYNSARNPPLPHCYPEKFLPCCKHFRFAPFVTFVAFCKTFWLRLRGAAYSASFAAIASRKPTQGCASQNNLTPHLHDLTVSALPRVQGIQRFAASALSLFNPSTFQPFGATFWDENENLKNSILQHQHLARAISARSSHFPEPRWPLSDTIRHNPTQSDTIRATISRL